MIGLLLLALAFSMPSNALAAINTVYDAKLKLNEIKDGIKNTPIFDIILYSSSTIIFFAVAIIIVFFLIMLLKR